MFAVFIVTYPKFNAGAPVMAVADIVETFEEAVAYPETDWAAHPMSVYCEPDDVKPCGWDYFEIPQVEVEQLRALG